MVRKLTPNDTRQADKTKGADVWSARFVKSPGCDRIQVKDDYSVRDCGSFSMRAAKSLRKAAASAP